MNRTRNVRGWIRAKDFTTGLMGVFLLVPGPALAGERPNIVMIVSDDANKAYHGCYGSRTPTPNLDSLAREGALFDRAVAVTAMCNPTRHTILTGRFPGRDLRDESSFPEGEPYFVEQNTELKPGAVTIGRMLREGGYFTGYIGKWHNNFEHAQAGLEFINYPQDLGDDPGDPAYSAYMQKKHANDATFVGICTGFEYVDSLIMGNYPAGKPQELKHQNVDWQARGAVNFLEKAAKEERPFFLYVAHTVPHGPLAHESHEKDPRHSLQGLIEPVPDMPSRESVKQRLVDAGMAPRGSIYGINYGMVQLDDQVGTVLRRLEEMGVADNTIVIYFADHGIFGKFTTYFPGLDMPLVMKWPGRIKPGTVVEAPVSFVDFVPTLLAATGVEAPAGHALDGLNFLPAVEEGQALDRDTVYAESGYTRSVLKGRYQYIAFRLPQRLVEEMKAGAHEHALDHFGRSREKLWASNLNIPWKPHYFDPDQLYDVKVDPFCRNNLAEDPMYAELLAEMKGELKAYLGRFARPFDVDRVDPFFETAAYRELVRRHMERAANRNFYPPNQHGEMVFNLNLPDRE